MEPRRIAPHAKDYEHRLMGYNNDPAATFADVQKVFDLLEAIIAKSLKNPNPNSSQGCNPAGDL